MGTYTQSSIEAMRRHAETLGAAITDCRTGGHILKFAHASRFFGDSDALAQFLGEALRSRISRAANRAADNGQQRPSPEQIIEQGESLRRQQSHAANL
jgi:hypothetical protein